MMIPLLWTGVQASEPEAPASAETVVHANNAFAWHLFDELREAPGNLLISPYNIASALMIAGAGAAGQTAAEISETLHLPGAPLEELPTWGELEKRLAQAGREGPTTLDLANSLWLDAALQLQTGYLDSVTKYLAGEIKQVDFQSEPDAAREKINAWVEEKTREMIKDLLAPGTVDADTRMIIATAIYFLGQWSQPFEKDRTEELPFYLAPDQERNVPMMQQSERHSYFENEQVRILEMPYSGGDFSMVLMLPVEKHGLAKLEADLDPDLFEEWMGQLRSRKVEVTLPRFKFEWKETLNRTLQGMGMKKAFIPDQADFSGMTGDRSLFVGMVVHQAAIEVDEVGTEAAAATAIEMRVTAMPPPEDPAVFRADHPFLFGIRDRRNDALLFLGRLADPGS